MESELKGWYGEAPHESGISEHLGVRFGKQQNLDPLETDDVADDAWDDVPDETADDPCDDVPDDTEPADELPALHPLAGFCLH